MVNRILVDTNVLLDYLFTRMPFYEEAKKVVFDCAEGKVKGCIAAHSIPNMYFILRKDYNEQDRREVLYNLFQCLMLKELIKLSYWQVFRMRIFQILKTACRWSVQKHMVQNIS